MRKLFYLVPVAAVAVGVLLSLGCGQKKAETGEKAAMPASGKVATVSLMVEGMTCSSCAAGIQGSLTSLDGVLDADVSYDTGKAEVKYDPERTTPESIVDTINNLGYKARTAS